MTRYDTLVRAGMLYHPVNTLKFDREILADNSRGYQKRENCRCLGAASFVRQDDTKGVGQALADSRGLSPKTVRSLTAKCSHLQSGDL